MLQIGGARLGCGPCVALVVDRDTALLRNARDQGVHILEARIDRFAHLDLLSVLGEIKGLKKHGLPIIATVRSSSEGGLADLSPAERLKLYQAVLPWVDAVDVELASAALVRALGPLLKKARKPLILSYHHFGHTPPDQFLTERLRRARILGAQITKIAVLAKKGDDVLRMYEFTRRHRRKNIITISLGPRGTLSRVLFPTAGSLIAYTGLIPFDGQIPLRELVSTLKLLYQSKGARNDSK
ncbi:MAG: type I 3-dehydroquinate dehydratase [Candidatus Omnitrophica bacterium]|nr:type I 3-dehydroquinate dehydratase [Candidatus Omnitrophota bacterium]